mmetsp:Transcript_5377/g.8255  ORF Transcript_5377/g.8255 Transcript_5377/m.8255 type:complete len:150 (+) Transcript_5377:187-636(+)|eukprot:CAMPEP_0178916110 /NCGR_PEP_ID=MMETSP0786-20121207/12434_1 /TAXON_ID=186022 /ORGANISM="Thalassionema frauenfeldii, Strain CCMP 1798" /LENGTH=149 /DNA_ID=CAMNT_0020589363 /DNA_START=182 /DNA_END=631 /DNA_ORIENTATION=-
MKKAEAVKMARRRVCFRPIKDVHEFTPISDPLLKNRLYYSRHDILTMELQAKYKALEFKLKKLQKRKKVSHGLGRKPSSTFFLSRSQLGRHQHLLLQSNAQLYQGSRISLEHSRNMLQRIRVGKILKCTHDQLRANDMIVRNVILSSPV